MLHTAHTVLFVDDEPNILRALQRLLRTEDMQVLCAACPQEALEILDRQPVQVLVSDQHMPEMSGVDLLSQACELHPDLVPMMLTGGAHTGVAGEATDRGEIFRLMTKPWNRDELRAALRHAFAHADVESAIERLRAVTREQRPGCVRMIAALAKAVDARDACTRGHSERVGAYASKLAQEMGHGSALIERVYIAGLLHDVGGVGMRDTLIPKPSGLTPTEFAEVERHPEIGAKILERVEILADIVPCVRHHHEWFDGCDRGYPLRLQGDQIPLPARIIGVAEAVEAMTGDRPYRKALPMNAVFAELTQYSGRQFDPRCVDAMLRLLDREGERFIHPDQPLELDAVL